MLVKYVGGFDPVETEDRNTGVVHQARPGETIDVTDEWAELLCEQPANWRPVKSSTPKGEK